VVTTLAGGVGGANGVWADKSGSNAGVNDPSGVAVDSSGNVFVADTSNNRIRKVTAGGGTRIGGPVTLRGQSCQCWPESKVLSVFIDELNKSNLHAMMP
jgi:hypothetical protein